MPLTVTCPACASPFTLSEDLLQRKVAGNLVTVKCRHCSAEIALDVNETSALLPSHEAPRRAPSPPRRKTQLGLGPAPAAARLIGQSAADTPLGVAATRTPLPSAVAATPLPRDAIALPRGLGTVPKTVKIEALPIWDDSEETVQINAPKLPPEPPPKPAIARHLPRVPHPPRKVREEEPELIEAEEIPASSSDAVTLDAPLVEPAQSDLQSGKRAADESWLDSNFELHDTRGAPTIDVSHLDEPPPSIDRIDVDVDIIEEAEIEALQAARAKRSRTMPLYDLSDLLPPASDSIRRSESVGAVAKTQASDSPASVSLPAPESKARGRKFVVAPHSPPAEANTATAPASAPKAKPAGAALWFGLVAVAAGVVAVVGLRGHQPEVHVANEPTAVPTRESPASGATTVATIAPVTPEVATVAASAALVEPSATPSVTMPATKAIATTVSAPTTTSSKANVTREPALEAAPLVAPTATNEVAKPELPTAPSKPVEAHNAPPAAEDGTEFDPAAARSALASAATQASACRKDGDPSGTATITITFAPSGRVTSANLQGPPFAGTATGGCIANTMRHATVPAFSGERVTVTKSIVVQ
jgi:hypothetical protein